MLPKKTRRGLRARIQACIPAAPRNCRPAAVASCPCPPGPRENASELPRAGAATGGERAAEWRVP